MTQQFVEHMRQIIKESKWGEKGGSDSPRVRYGTDGGEWR